MNHKPTYYNDNGDAMTYLSFKLSDDFVAQYENIRPDWGLDIGAGNSLAELTFLTKYSRLKPDGSKEQWFQVCQRVVEGMYSILKDQCKSNQTPWNDFKGQKSAQEAYDRMFTFKWTPPGRGMWMMGTALVNEENNAAPLYNCAFVSTEKLSSHSAYEATLPFVRMMSMSMYGIGVGFDTRGADRLTVKRPSSEVVTHVVGDSREGWCDALDILLVSYFMNNKATVKFDYSEVRPAGTPLKRFGGTASGAGPLIRLIDTISERLESKVEEQITSMDIMDIMNWIGKCVVAGSIRRTAQISLGDVNDTDFIDAKNWKVNPERMGVQVDEEGNAVVGEDGWPLYSSDGGWGNMSNNSIVYGLNDTLDHLVERVAMNGEPGLINLGLIQNYGRLDGKIDTSDSKAIGVNPCAEIALESHELCNLVEVFPSKHDDKADFLRTIKFAYLYSKVVTLLPTPWAETNEVIKRNRRIGTSVTGVVDYVEKRGLNELCDWLDDGYDEVLTRDEEYSSWLGIRPSIRKTTVKPSGTTSLIASTTPGCHWPVSSGKYVRRQRFSVHNPEVAIFRDAGYHIEPDVMDPQYTVVVSFPVDSVDVRDEKQVSIWEKAALAAKLQRYWADNSVSVTITFTPEETDQVGPVMRFYADQLKCMSFLPLDTGSYAQMPYEKVSDEEWQVLFDNVEAIDPSTLYFGTLQEAEGDRFCSNDSCEVPQLAAV